ncbi:ChaC-like protein [Cutaneotrichosporon oleaginosum]|uniref:glutathione-specific gamma-glutamylcyclotransferase n=1 Tax=Cutaneotrichosporon oleaginosum TaxID=879819 RepID=A0A0J0XLV5_9TREE|nr:ChaC-like protein [Cutaneotrichosporon oleaginosum]KLT42082.1 ChaC-like protein [Cutaneotrichosporon oleaginosum]TXT04679.1 hypothetical protein COLE_07498 [Cutaneotrichosporon oleaginosum]
MTWIFGYGSIIWRPDFPYAERTLAFVANHTRRFWQGSPDHRGTPTSLGRVVTLVPEEGAVCWGFAYRVPPERVDEVMAYLDHRERGGYVRITVPFHRAHAVCANPLHNIKPEDAVESITYIAAPDNEHYLGPDALPRMVKQIAGAAGESGRNADYVINLATHLKEMGLDDPHVFTLAQAVREAVAASSASPIVKIKALGALEDALEEASKAEHAVASSATVSARA